MFATNYLELLGFGQTGSQMRPELVALPPGLNGLVLATADADAQYRDLQARGIAVQAPQSFSRPVTVAGASADAKFRTTHLAASEVPFGRLYFCQHDTRDLVWRPEWQQHPNGASEILGILIGAADPTGTAALFRRMFDADPEQNDGTLRLMAGQVTIDIATHDTVARQLGEAAPQTAGRTACVAAIRLRSVSLQQTAAALPPGVARLLPDGSLRVPAAAACDVALEFAA
jgi:hypothetical protein